jgi:hypothetical protein
VYLERLPNKSAVATSVFLVRTFATCPAEVTKVLTDNANGFADRFCATG